MAGTKSKPADTTGDADDRLNEKFHTLLRDAAEKREGRARIHSSEDAAAARQESADLIGLARDPERNRRA